MKPENPFSKLLEQPATPKPDPITRTRAKPTTGKRSDDAYKRFGFLLETDVHERAFLRLRSTGKRDMSELVNELLKQYSKR